MKLVFSVHGGHVCNGVGLRAYVILLLGLNYYVYVLSLLQSCHVETKVVYIYINI